MAAQAERQAQRAAKPHADTGGFAEWRSYTPLPDFSKAPTPSPRETRPVRAAPARPRPSLADSGRSLPWRHLLGALFVGVAALWFSGPGEDAVTAVLDSPCTWLNIRYVPAGTPRSKDLLPPTSSAYSCNCQANSR